MKNFKVSLKSVLLTGICFLFLSTTNAQNDQLPVPKIQAGIARVTGSITNFKLKKGDDLPELTLAVPSPVTAETGIFKKKLSEDGSFDFEVPVECSINVGMIGSQLFPADVVSLSLIHISEPTRQAEISYAVFC